MPFLEGHQLRVVLTLAYLALLGMYLLTATVASGDMTNSHILCNFPLTVLVGTLGIGVKLLFAFHVLTTDPILMHTFLGEVEAALGISGANDEEKAGGGNIQSMEQDEGPQTFSLCRWRHGRRRRRRGGAAIAAWSCARGYAVRASLRRRRCLTLIGAVCVGMIVWLMPVVFHWRIYGDQISCVLSLSWASDLRRVLLHRHREELRGPDPPRPDEAGAEELPTPVRPGSTPTVQSETMAQKCLEIAQSERDFKLADRTQDRRDAEQLGRRERGQATDERHRGLQGLQEKRLPRRASDIAIEHELASTATRSPTHLDGITLTIMRSRLSTRCSPTC